WSWVGALISFAGIGLIAVGGGETVRLESGALLILAAAAFTSISSILQKPLLARLPAVVVTAWVIILGSAPLLPAAPGAFVALQAAPPAVLAAITFLILMSTAAAYVGW